MTVFKFRIVVLGFFTFLILTLTAGCGLAQAQEPIVLERDYSQKAMQLKGWIDGAKANHYDTYKVPESSELRGARLFISMIETRDARKALKDTMTYEGFTSLKFNASTPVKYVDEVLDDNGFGAAYIGSMRLKGERYKFAATALYISPGDDLPPRTEIFIFAAPEPIYRRMGSWSPVAIAWFRSSFVGLEDYIVINGKQTPQEQADDLALSTDMWLEYLAKTMDNIVALSIIQTGRNVEANCEAMDMENSPTSAC